MKKIVRIMGGLGNQMFQYALARELFATKNDMEIVLDIDCDSAQVKRKYELNKFNTIQFRLLNNLKSRIYRNYRTIHTRNSGSSKKTLLKYGFEFEPFVFQDNTNYVYLDGYWQNINYFKSIKDILLNEFTLKNHKYEKEQIAVNNEIDKTNSVGVHVRRGDYLSQTNRNIYELQTIEYYTNAIDIVKERINNPVLFVFSDDISWCREAFSRIDGIVYVDCNSSAVEDFDMLKKCKHKIITNSTFSWWAAWLSQDAKSLVIAPTEWYKDKYVNTNCKKALLSDYILI